MDAAKPAGETLQFMQLFRHLLCQIVRLGPVFRGVIELPGIVVKSGRYLANEDPWRLMPRHGSPALVVDAAVAEHLKILCLMLLGRFRVIERVSHADAFDRMLLHTVHKNRLGQSGHFQDSRRYVNHVMELAA